MDPRTTTASVTFIHPFRLPGHENELPPGDYEVIVEDELLQGLSFAAYRRTASYIVVRGQSGGGVSEMRLVEPGDLEAALERDRGTTA